MTSILANNYGANEPLVGGGVLQPEAHVRPGVDGIARPVHDIGMPIVFAPFVRLAVPLTNALTRVVPEATMRRARLNPPVLYRQLLSLAMIALAAVLAGLMFDALVALGASTRTAFGTAALLMLSPPLLVFSVLFFTELLSALLCFVVFYRICLRDVRGTVHWWWLGCLTGFLFLLHARNIGLTIPLTALALYQLRGPVRRGEAGAFALGVCALVAVRTGVNYWFWGALISGPHARLAGWPGWASLIGETTTRTIGLLVDQEFGLLIYAPIVCRRAVGLESPHEAETGCGGVSIPDRWPLRRAHHLPSDERAWLDRRLEPGRAVPDADCAAARTVRVRGTARSTTSDCRRRGDAPDRHQRLRLAAPQDPVERRRRASGVVRLHRPSACRFLPSFARSRD